MSFATVADAVARHTRRMVIKCAFDLEAHAKNEIQSGQKSGHTYDIGRAGSVILHRASAPGEAPANQYGVLAGSISTVPSADPTEAEARVLVTAEYGAALEFGREDGSIAARPYIRPAADLVERSFAQQIGRAVQAGAREGGVQ